MQLKTRTLSAIGKVITGDPIDRLGKSLSPHQSGYRLVEFFNEFGGDHHYGQGFPSRWQFVENRLNEYNGTDTLKQIIVEALNPARFGLSELSENECADYINKYLKFDGYEVKRIGDNFVVRDIHDDVIKIENRFTENKLSHEFIKEQIEKSDTKIASGDYSGAITNARSLIEAVLIELESRLSSPQESDGDLPKLYKRVQKLLHLEPSRTDINDSLKTVLSGLSSIVAGIAPMRNRMSDAHATSYRPAKRHAKLAVNAAKTLADFLFESFEYQSAQAKKKA